jgi:uncharacterized protein
MRYEVKADVGGKLAQLGGRLIDSAAKRLADEFFEKFTAIVGPASARADASPTAPVKKKGWLSRLLGRKDKVAAAS